MGKKNKFDKIERNETYYEAYGEEEKKAKKKDFFGLDTKSVPEKKELSSKFTYKREKKKAADETETDSAEKELEKPIISPFVLTLVVFCLAFAMQFITESTLLSSFVQGKETAVTLIMYAAVYVVPSVVYMVLTAGRARFHYVKGFSLKLLPFSFACLGLVLSLTALQKYLIAYTFAYSEPTAASSHGILFSILVGALLPAVCEELFVHGILQKETADYAGGLSGILVSSLVFAMLHFELQYFFVYFVAALVMGALTHVTGSVLPAMLVHFLNNLLSIMFSERLGFIATERIGGTLLIIVIAAICFGFLILCLNIAEKISEKRADNLARINRSAEEDDGTETDSDNKVKGFVRFFASEGKTFKRLANTLKTPPMLICYVIFMVTLFLNFV